VCSSDLGKTGGQVFTDTHRIIKNRKELIINLLTPENEILNIVENLDDLLKVPVMVSAVYANITPQFKIPSDQFSACFDSEKISFPMTIRRWKSGDYFYPFGMKQKKKLSDYFIDNKYSKIDKENTFILESDGKIAWIIGDRIDDRFKITSSTKKGLLLKSKRKASVFKPVK
jgi:tRNA(Ile)-lysidine synthase